MTPGTPAPSTMERFPSAPLWALDTLWFQVAGTICNIRCAHCFISCSPTNHSHEMMPLATVRRYLDEAAEIGVREYYFTGGEPFMNKEMLAIAEAALAQGPVSILTNGLLLRPAVCERLKTLSDASEYSLELRVSLDGLDAASNDPIRGAGTFDRIMAGIANLSAAGLNPVITTTEACADAASRDGRTRFLGFLSTIGLMKPRLKILPLLRIGEEARRTHAYESWETLRGRELTRQEGEALQCGSCRMVTSRGVYVCPILIDMPAARMAGTLKDSMRPFELRHQACFTCHLTGFSCRT